MIAPCHWHAATEEPGTAKEKCPMTSAAPTPTKPLVTTKAKTKAQRSKYLGVLPRVDILGAVDDRRRGAHYVAVHVAAPPHSARPDLHDALRAVR